MSETDELAASAELLATHLDVIDRITAKCRTYYTGTVTQEAVVYFLLQLRRPQLVEHCLRLLDSLYFVDSPKLAALMGKAFARIPEAERQGARLCALGTAFDSGALVGYEFSKTLGWSEAELAQRWFDFETPPAGAPALVLLDDNVTSGTQLLRLISEMHPDHVGSREHLKTPLTPAALEGYAKTKIYVVVALELAAGAPDVEKAAAARGLQMRILSGAVETTSWLEYSSPLWNTQDEAQTIRGALAGIGDSLLKDRGWKPEITADRALGYGNLQRLACFSHNVPKSLITAFWKYGRCGGKPWIPLLPERREWAEHKEQILAVEPELQLVVRLVLSGMLGKSAPLLAAGVLVDGDIAPAAQLQLPSAKVCTQLAEFFAAKAKPMKKREMKPPSSSGMFDVRSPFEPTDADVAQFNLRVDEYNEEVGAFPKVCGEFCEREARLVSFPVRIYNNGSRVASEVVLRLYLPSDDLFLPVIPERPAPPAKPEKPEGLTSIIRPRKLELDALRDIRDTLNVRVDETRSVVQVRDRKETLLLVPFGKIVQGTFVDRPVEFLRLPRLAKLQLRYQVICEESARPLEGAFEFETIDGKVFPASLRNAWF